MIRLTRTKRGRREKLRFFPGLKNLNEKMPHSINASAIKPIDNLVVTPAYNFAWPFLFEPFSPSMLPMYFSLLTELHLSLTRSDRIDRLVFCCCSYHGGEGVREINWWLSCSNSFVLLVSNAISYILFGLFWSLLSFLRLGCCVC